MDTIVLRVSSKQASYCGDRSKVDIIVLCGYYSTACIEQASKLINYATSKQAAGEASMKALLRLY